VTIAKLNNRNGIREFGNPKSTKNTRRHQMSVQEKDLVKKENENDTGSCSTGSCSTNTGDKMKAEVKTVEKKAEEKQGCCGH
jgi:hypothetical protein